MVTFILFVVIFGIVVISHEFGHFLLAKANGIHVVEFSVGMGPTLFSFGKGETKYSLKLLPIGGACMFEGEDGLNTKEGEESEGSFQKANVWSRISTVFAGPLFNFILAFIVAFLMVNLIIIREPYINQVVEDSAASEAGLLAGDKILSLNGERVYLFEEVSLYTALNTDKEIEIVVERDGREYRTTLVPRYDEEQDRYMMGIVNSDMQRVSGLKAFRYAWYEVRYSVKNTYKSLGMLLTGKVKRTDVAGPVGIAVNVVGKVYEETKESWQDVLVNMLNIVMLLSVNLGILNLLPLPALDGGRLVFLILEVIRRKPIPPEKEGMVHFAGLIFFMILMVFIFFNDLNNIFLG